MNPLEKKNVKWVSLSVIFALFVVAAVLVVKSLTTCEPQPNVTITFPNGFADVVSQEGFVKALNAHSKPYDATHKTFVVYWDGNLVPDGVPGSQPTFPNAGSHVTQWVSFSCMAQLEQFAEQAKGNPDCSP